MPEYMLLVYGSESADEVGATPAPSGVVALTYEPTSSCAVRPGVATSPAGSAPS